MEDVHWVSYSINDEHREKDECASECGSSGKLQLDSYFLGLKNTNGGELHAAGFVFLDVLN